MAERWGDASRTSDSIVATAEMQSQYDVEWEDPLPHALVKPKAYLSNITDRTKAVVIFMHGRGDSIDDMVGQFLPTFSERYGGAVDVRDTLDEAVSSVSLIGLEARDNIWYPQGPVRTPLDAKINGPYSFSALDCLRKTVLDVALDPNHPIPLSRIVLVGFSQGAILANAYLVAALEQHGGSDAPLVPAPAHIFSLAGSLYELKPPFPERPAFGSEGEALTYLEAKAVEQRVAKGLVNSHQLSLHLICGDRDRYFSAEEIHDTARSLVRAKDDAILSGSVFASNVDISVGIEAGAGHSITHRMMAAIIRAVDAVCAEQ